MNNKVTHFGVIFDMDGVLINSTKYIWESFNKILEPYGVHFSKKDIRKYSGRSLKDKIILWNKDYNLNLDFDEFSRKTGKFELDFMSGIKPNKDLIYFLDELKNYNTPLAVGTCSQRWRTDKILDLLDIKDYFKAIVCFEDVKNYKPHPEVFITAGKRLELLPEKSIVIEDTPAGIEGAKLGGMKAIAYLTNTNHTKREFKKADLIISGFKELSFYNLRDLVNSK
jgi:beta-phosphoglucomutase